MCGNHQEIIGVSYALPHCHASKVLGLRAGFRFRHALVPFQPPLPNSLPNQASKKTHHGLIDFGFRCAR
jgi:hypothetical protein